MDQVVVSAQEGRVLGSLIEKSMTTPDHYPMSLNAVVTACNQVSNREPVVTYDDALVERTLRGLADRGLAKMVHRHGDRVVKYRHAADEVLELSPPATALLAVLLLRGAQTPGELRQRTSRYVDFDSLAELEAELYELQQRQPALVARIGRRPGQKEHRYRQLLDEEEDARPDGIDPPPIESEPEPTVVPAGAEASGDGAALDDLGERVAVLEARVQRLLDELGIAD